MSETFRIRCCAVAFSAFSLLPLSSVSADQPLLGFEGTLVECRQAQAFGIGYRIDKVRRGSLAHRMGLERGDIVFRVAGMEFATHEAYLYALRNAGEVVEIRLVNVRNGKVVKRRCRLGKRPQKDQGNPPEGFAIVDEE